MTVLELMQIVKELGLSIGIFALCAWMVMYIVRKMVDSIDKLIRQNETFMGKVRNEHENLQKQHDEMIQTLGRINGYKDH